MKKAFLLLTFAAVALFGAEDVQVKTMDNIATAPADYSGPAEEFVNWALMAKPKLLNNEVVINRAVDVSPSDLTTKWRLDAVNSQQDLIGEVTASGKDSIYNEASEKQVKEKVEYYTTILDNKVNPLVEQIENEVQKADGKTVTMADKTAKAFMFQSDGAAENTFFGKFFKRIQQPYNDVLSLLFFFFTFFALVFLVMDSVLAKNQNWKLEWIRRGVVGIPIVIIFFTSSSSSTTRAQDFFAGFVSYGTGVANAIANHAHVSNAEGVMLSIAKPQGSNVGQIEDQVKRMITEDQKAEVYAGILNSCMSTYDADRFKEYRTEKSNNLFPASADEFSMSDWEFTNVFLKSSALNTDTEKDGIKSYFSIGTCAATESAYKQYATDSQKREAFLKKVVDFNPGNLKAIAVKAMNTNISYGWVSVALLPAQQAMANSAPSNIDKNLDKSAWDGVDFKSANSVESFAKQLENFDLSRTVDSYSQRFAFLMIPGVSGIFDASKLMLTSVFDVAFSYLETVAAGSKEGAQASTNILTFFIPGGTNAVAGAAGATLKAISIVKSTASTVGAFYLATGAGKMIIESLVYLSMVAVTGLSIALWFFEVLKFSIVLPFVSLYAFGENAKANVTQFIIQGVGIALKPALIVICVLAALQVGAFFESITSGLITKQDLMLMSKANAVLDATEWSFSNPLAGFGEWLVAVMNKSIIMSLLFIVTAVTKIWLMIYIVLKGPGMFLEYFGKHIDSSHMVDSISQKGQAYSGGL